MARKATTATIETSAPAALSLVARPSATGVRRASRSVEQDPAYPGVEAALVQTLTEGPLQYELSTMDEVKRVKGLLATARKNKDIGLTQSVSESGTGTFLLDFAANATKRERKYTAADIRKYALENGHGEIIGRIPQHIRDAFREANGFKVKKNDTDTVG